MILVNGVAENRISIADRGLQYGDGLFETIAYRKGVAEFLDAHLTRLLNGCKRLAIPFQDIEILGAELNSLCHQLSDDAVIKIIITRGCGGRGYFADSSIEPTRIISSHPYPSHPNSNAVSGVRVRLCKQTLSENSSLAGIKHLNRLEQVLARNEWDDSDIAEGLMFDQGNNVIEGTMSNVFIVKENQLLTPKVNKAGVAGIIRAHICKLAQQNGLTVEEKNLSKAELFTADEIFVCNSIIGIWPVSSIDNKIYATGPITKNLQQALAESAK